MSRGRGRLSAFGSLVVIGARGIRSRLLLALGSFVLAALAIGAAVVGPMYQSGASNSFLVSGLQAQQNFLTGFTFDYRHFPQQPVSAALTGANGEVKSALPKEFVAPHNFVWSLPSQAPDLSPNGGQPTLVAAPGACAHVLLTGHCPTEAGQIIMLRADAKTIGVHIGSTFHPWGEKRALTVVGLYQPSTDATYWFNLSRLQSIPFVPGSPASPPVPYQPAPFITAMSSFTSNPLTGWYIRSDRRLLVTAKTTSADLTIAKNAAHRVLHDQTLTQGPLGYGAIHIEVGNALPAIANELLARQSTARSTVSPAVLSVILVSLVLLMRLLASAMDLRRPELALASLRGFSRRQMWLLGLMEPLLVLAVATPVGVVGGFLFARWLSRLWLVPGLPSPLAGTSILAAAAVLLVSVLVAGFVARDALSEPLSAQIAGVRRPTRSSRWGLIARLILVAAAIAVLATAISRSHAQAPDVTDLLLPILLATAVGLVTTLGAQWLAGRWAILTSRRRGLFAYVASRTVSRRREGTFVILPLTAALAVSVFAAGVFSAAADWRASDAATIVGADDSYTTHLSMGQAVRLTHQIDPQGRWLMAAAATYPGPREELVVDAPRLARVSAWQQSWTPGISVQAVQSALETHLPPVTMTGDSLSVTLDNRVTGSYASLGIQLNFVDDGGNQRSVLLGPYPKGVSTLTVPLPECVGQCTLNDMNFGGPAALSEAMHGSVVIEKFDVGGRPAAHALTQGWRSSVPTPGTPNPVVGQPVLADGHLTVTFDAATQNSYADITPNDVPTVRPVLWGRTALAKDRIATGALDHFGTAQFQPITTRSIGTAESMPLLGPKGMMIDYTMLTRDVSLNSSITFVHILARSDTPASVLKALANHGIVNPVTLSSTRHLLDQDAFALALNLYIVVTLLVIALAIAGLGTFLTVQMPARRRDAASLRVVGVRRRTILAAVVTEYLAVLGVAAIAGVAAGALSQYVVVRSVTLGFADTQNTPRLLPSLNLGGVTELLVVVVAGLFVLSLGVAALTVRGARTASLRENAR